MFSIVYRCFRRAQVRDILGEFAYTIFALIVLLTREHENSFYNLSGEPGNVFRRNMFLFGTLLLVDSWRLLLVLPVLLQYGLGISVHVCHCRCVED